ncbi:MAG: transglycosylase SLT domain-containing protein [Acidobacteriota bacterium]
MGEAIPIYLIVAGAPRRLRVPVTTIGRASENDIVVSGHSASVVSGRHAELRHDGARWRIRDLASTNGTFVNGTRIKDAPLEAPCTIQLGRGGPELAFTTELAPPVSQLERTLVAPRHDRSRYRLKFAIALLAASLAAVSAFAGLRIRQLNRSKAGIDSRIAALERELAARPDRAGELAGELDRYQALGSQLQGSLFYRLSAREREDFLDREIRALLAEFGAEVYSIPPGFRQAVSRYLDEYRGPDRPNFERALAGARPAMERVGRILAEHKLPPDFAYMMLVESALESGQQSSAGAAGFWQFTPATARAFGLRVGEAADDRLNVEKSTRAACKYIRSLILDFGTGSSVMLALAAYNLGPARVKQAINRVNDPIRQRSFWYLYRTGALPEETREYVPKVFAAMIIGRHPERYGF